MGCHQLRWSHASGGQSGHLEIVRWCHEWSATDLNEAMYWAARKGHLEIVKQCREWGATHINGGMAMAFEENHDEMVQLCLVWVTSIPIPIAIEQKICRHIDYSTIHGDRHHQQGFNPIDRLFFNMFWFVGRPSPSIHQGSSYDSPFVTSSSKSLNGFSTSIFSMDDLSTRKSELGLHHRSSFLRAAVQNILAFSSTGVRRERSSAVLSI